MSRVQKMQNQILKTNKVLEDRWKNRKKTRQELKSRSLTFVDPYGNRTTNQYMDHQLLSTVFERYKKNYIPKYLHNWIQIGKMNQSKLVSLKEYELKRTVSEYEDGFEFKTCGKIPVWIRYHQDLPTKNFELTVRLTDNMETIAKQINKRRQCSTLELKSLIFENGGEPTDKDWHESATLKLNDTVLSAQLYQENCVIVAEVIPNTVDRFF